MEASLLPHFDSTVRKDGLGRNMAKWQRELSQFFERSTQCRDALEKSMRANALGNWLTRVHELRNAASAIGARKLAGFCNEAEQFRTLRNDDAKALLYHIEKEIAYLKASLH